MRISPWITRLLTGSLFWVLCSAFQPRVTLDSTFRSKCRLQSSQTAAERATPANADQAAAIASSFLPTEFNPVPWLTNCHVQTIGGLLVRGIPECAYVSSDENNLALVGTILQSIWRDLFVSWEKEEESWWDRRERIETPDGDWFHADSKDVSDEDDAPLVVLLHGLEANSEAGLSLEIAQAYAKMGMNVVCLNFRGCSGTPNDTLGGYHVGFTDDLIHYLELYATARKSHQPVYLSGFSLGANAVLKALGDLGETAWTRYNIQGAAVGCVPLDCERNVKFIDAPGVNRALYSESFLKSARQKATQQLQQFCNGDIHTDRFDYPGSQSASTIAEFDDAYIAPIYGFANNVDYYRKSSCAYVLDQIQVPTLILNAGDDPFFDPSFFPVEAQEKAPLQMVRTEHGGHLGFAFHRVDSEKELRRIRQEGRPSYAPWELARFLQHVREQTDRK